MTTKVLRYTNHDLIKLFFLQNFKERVHKYQHLVWTFQKTPKMTFGSKIFKTQRIYLKFLQLVSIAISN